MLEIVAEFRLSHFGLGTGCKELKLLVSDAVAVLVVSGDGDSAAAGDRESRGDEATEGELAKHSFQVQQKCSVA